MDAELQALSEEVGKYLSERSLVLATAESCTGGWVAETVTATPGSSAWFDRGFVTYSNEAKRDMLDVGVNTLMDFGAVSEETAREMAQGALKHSKASVALAITGIAGPAGGSPDKPVGSVCFAWRLADGRLLSERCLLQGDREGVRRQAVLHALRRLLAECRRDYSAQ